MSADSVIVKFTTQHHLFVTAKLLGKKKFLILIFIEIFLKGITGESCNRLDTSGLPCSSNPCHGNSVCVNMAENYVCVCGPGRTGKDCRDHGSPCQCQNGGACISASDGAFRCKCLSGYG